MPLQATSGAASYDAFGGGVPVVPNYIEEVFSTTLYTGNGSTQTITNGIDLSANGGLVWGKSRSAVNDHFLINTVRGAANSLSSNLTDGNSYDPDRLTAFTTSGFSVGTSGSLNTNGTTYASWTFRKQPKFFDVVTYTGNGTNGRNISHSLGATPACIIVKRTDSTSNWSVYHQGNIDGSGSGQNTYRLNTTAAANNLFNVDRTSDTQFNVSDNSAGVDSCNVNGGTYVAYLFASNAGGFGLTGTDNVISCGSFTTSSGGGDATVNLGYEPQWLLVKSSSGISGWDLMDNMRGMPNYGTYGSATALEANNSNAEGSRNPNCYPTATGFYYARAASTTYIYIAIRRGPMKVPTSGTSVFSPIAYTGNSTTNTTVQNLTTSFAGDAVIIPQRTGGNNPLIFDKLRGKTQALYTSLTSTEQDINAFRAGQSVGFNNTQTVLTGQFTAQGNYNYSGDTFVGYNFKRAPSFFDVVCYKGNGSTQTITHNLSVVPELIIGKNRTTAGNNWPVLFNFASTTMNYGFLNLTNSCPNDTYANVGVFSAAPTSTSMFLVNSGSMNTNTDNHVAYLFATCAGVSKVGSYTGTGTTKQIDCGFTGGARFVLIKKTSGTGSWYVWDSARGIVSGNDPYLLLNSTAAEVTNTDYIDTYSAGFEISSTAPSEINENGGSFIFLAIA